MPVAIPLLLVGAVALIAGSTWATRGLAGIAYLGGEPGPVATTIVAGLDLAPAVLALCLLVRGGSSTAASALFGAATFALTLGPAVALATSGAPIEVGAPEVAIYPAVPLVASAALVANSSLSRPAGAILIATWGIWVWLEARRVPMEGAGQALRREARSGFRVPPLPLVAIGLAVAAIGGFALAEGGMRLESAAGLAPALVGAAVLGPIASAQTVRRTATRAMSGPPDRPAASLFGTVASTVGALGLVALIRPVALDPAGVVAFIAMAAAYALDAFALLWAGVAGWRLAVALIAADAGWIWLALRV